MSTVHSPDVTTYGWMLVSVCIILTVGFIVHFVQLVRKLRPDTTYLILTAGTGIAAVCVGVTVSLMDNHFQAKENNLGTQFPRAALVLLVVAGFIFIFMSSYFFSKRNLALGRVCGMSLMASMLLFVAYLARHMDAAWTSTVFIIGQYTITAILFLILVVSLLQWLAQRRFNR